MASSRILPMALLLVSAGILHGADWHAGPTSLKIEEIKKIQAGAGLEKAWRSSEFPKVFRLVLDEKTSDAVPDVPADVLKELSAQVQDRAKKSEGEDLSLVVRVVSWKSALVPMSTRVTAGVEMVVRHKDGTLLFAGFESFKSKNSDFGSFSDSDAKIIGGKVFAGIRKALNF